MKFIDYLSHTATKNKSVLCAGFDPVVETFPTYFLKSGDSKKILTSFYCFAIETLKESVACIKPNIAFFEQYGLDGMTALKDILSAAREHKLPIILDAKRGDIGSTAKAYADAYFKKGDFESDAVTVNPFLGFDTVKVFLDSAAENEKGIFVLVKTSNPGSSDLQDLSVNGKTISERLAAWIVDNKNVLAGSTKIAEGLSGLGAVVGATHASHLATLRDQMPGSLLLVPGYGAQGGTAADVLPAFTGKYLGAVINASRGLMSFKNKNASFEELKIELLEKANSLATPLNEIV